MIQFFFFLVLIITLHQHQARWTVVEKSAVAWKCLALASRVSVRRQPQHIKHKKVALNMTFCWKSSTLHHIHEAQTVGQQGWNKTLPMGAMSQKIRKERKRWSVWATGEDGRWLSTTMLKRQNVAHNSDRCSLITAVCQPLQQRTVVVFEMDPGPVNVLAKSVSLSRTNPVSLLIWPQIISIEQQQDWFLKSGINERLNRKAAPTPAGLSSSSRDSGARGPVALAHLSTGHF